MGSWIRHPLAVPASQGELLEGWLIVNPLSLILLGLGVIMIVIGVKGSQKKVLASLKGAKPTG